MAGRPRKKDDTTSTKKKEVKKQETNVDIDKLVAEKVAEQMAKFLANQQIENMKEKTEVKEETHRKTKPSLLKSKRRKFVPDNTLVRVEQSIDGKFIIADNRGSNYFIELNGYGDNTTMSFKDLKNYHGKHHSFLNKGKLKIIDVISESGEIEFEDVIQDLNLQRIYESENRISPLDIEYYLLDEESLSEFTEKVRNSTEILETLIEVSNILYNRGEFNDNSKMDVLRQVSKNYDLFKSKSTPSNVRRVGNDLI